ncbi:MAG: MTH938/NDUFAF3 family protein [Candidatus Heimdallarchaeaceae archaeon]
MRFEGTKFGSITIEGHKYKHDVYLLPKDNEEGFEIKKRDKKLSYKIKRHTCLGPEEMKYLLSFNPEFLIIGKGQRGILPIPDETRALLNEFDGELVEDTTPKVLSKTNELIEQEKRVVAILHVTC